MCAIIAHRVVHDLVDYDRLRREDDSQVDGGHAGLERPVGDEVAERVFADEARVGRVGERPVGRGAQGAVADVVDDGDGRRRTVDIAVIGEHPFGGWEAGGGFGDDRVDIGEGDRWVIDGGEIDRDGHRCGCLQAVTGGVGEAVRPEVVLLGNVLEGPVGGERQRTVGGRADDDRLEGVAFRIVVVGEHAWGGGRQGGVLAAAVAVCRGGRAAVDVDEDGGRAERLQGAIAGTVAERGGAAKALGRGVAEAAIGGEIERAGGGDRNEHGTQRRPLIGIAIVGQDARGRDVQHLPGLGDELIIGHHWPVGDRGDV